MKQRPRIYYTEAQKALMWDRWKAGDTLHEIGKLFDRPHTSIHTILSATGGIQLRARRRSDLALPLAEREEISRSLTAGDSIRCVARRLKRAASTISRELLRNGGETRYRATKADEGSWGGHVAQRRASWPAILRWHRSWRVNCRVNGCPSK
ncbi:helix-turn-helix domain-containing protein [Comamonas testosteroni]|uniref:helix-turn-helix domain-containing protein n=1 Tax=Comamonas testosteroni TaxID=285 RepID=UPI000ADD065D